MRVALGWGLQAAAQGASRARLYSTAVAAVGVGFRPGRCKQELGGLSRSQQRKKRKEEAAKQTTKKAQHCRLRIEFGHGNEAPSDRDVVAAAGDPKQEKSEEQDMGGE